MNPKRPRDLYLILMLGGLTALSPFAIDMYLPAFPKIATEFGVPAADVALSLSSYFVGLAVGQLFYGPFLDRFGRKRPLYLGLMVFILASLGCIFAPSNTALIGLRFIQALGGCAAQVSTTAMVADFFEGRDRAKIFSLLVLILGISPMLAPTTGAYLAVHFSWQAVFIVLAAIAAILLLISFFFLPEGRQPDPTHSLHIGQILKNYGMILSDRQFVVYVFGGALAFSGLFVYLAASPVIFLEIFQVTPETYGQIFAVLAAGIIGFSQLNIFLLRRWSSDFILKRAAMGAVAITFALTAGSYFNVLGLVGTAFLFFAFLASAGLVNPNAAPIALAPFDRLAGSASALMGSIQMAIGALASTAVGFVQAKEVFPFAVIMACTATTALFILIMGKSDELKGLQPQT